MYSDRSRDQANNCVEYQSFVVALEWTRRHGVACTALSMAIRKCDDDLSADPMEGREGGSHVCEYFMS